MEKQIREIDKELNDFDISGIKVREVAANHSEADVGTCFNEIIVDLAGETESSHEAGGGHVDHLNPQNSGTKEKLQPDAKDASTGRACKGGSQTRTWTRVARVAQSVEIRNKPWRFEHMWLEEEGCRDTVEAAWLFDAPGQAMARVEGKISHCQAKLKWWSRVEIGNITRNCPWFMLCSLSTTMLSLLFFISAFLIQPSLISMMDPITFSFPSFNSKSCSNMGSVTAGDGYLSITPELQNEVGRVPYSHPVLAWPANISTIFTVRISTFPNSTGSGDGMAFIFAQNNDPSPPNSQGFYLGLLDRSTEGGIVRQLAVELDTYKNEFDPDENHIGIDTTSMTNLVAAKSLDNTNIKY
ncbi:lectin 1 [Quercus suber]|uniref:Lectin 1 n=1 Tax=Quercus suber TaxID=58331 RepID=A0AAW0KFP6_QUESU